MDLYLFKQYIFIKEGLGARVWRFWGGGNKEHNEESTKRLICKQQCTSSVGFKKALFTPNIRAGYLLKSRLWNQNVISNRADLFFG